MKLCPIAIVVGCKGCFLFSVCPLKGVIGDFKKEEKKKDKDKDKTVKL